MAWRFSVSSKSLVFADQFHVNSYFDHNSVDLMINQDRDFPAFGMG